MWCLWVRPYFQLHACAVDCTGTHLVHCAGHDRPFTNNYGVWTDEFAELGLEHTLEVTWPGALSYFGEDRPVRLERSYGR